MLYNTVIMIHDTFDTRCALSVLFNRLFDRLCNRIHSMLCKRAFITCDMICVIKLCEGLVIVDTMV
jgi:hypothetical protein